MQKTFLFLLAFFFFASAKAQYEEKDFVHYTVKDGLSDNYITCIQQDEQGYIWAGTDIGLNRFDGTAFKNFYSAAPGFGLISGTIRNIKKSGNHQLGIVGRNGFQLLNTVNLSVKNYFIADSTAFKVQLNDVWDAVLLPDSSFALSTASGFYIFDTQGKISFRHDAYSLKDIGRQRIFYGREIFSNNTKEYLFYNEEKGLAYYNSDTKIFRNVNTYDNEWKAFCHPETESEKWITKYQINSNEFIFAFHLKDSIVYYNHHLNKKVFSPLPFKPAQQLSWQSKIVMLTDTLFAVNDGTKGFYLFHLNRLTGKITGDGKKFLAAYKITCLFTDKDKRLWAGTNMGLLQQKLNTPFINAYQYKSLPGDTLTGGFNCMYSYKNKLYAGRYSLSKGLMILDEATMLPQKQINIFGGNNSYNEILSIQMYHPDTLWLGTNGGILWFDTKTNRYGKLPDEKKYPWSKNFNGILAPALEDGSAWMCSYLNGIVVRYNIATRAFTVFTSQTKPALPFDKVKTIVYDSYGDVWISGHSLTRWSNAKQQFDTLISVYGGANKFNDDILTLSADNNGSLWMHNAFNGLLEYKIKEKKFISYTEKDGLPSTVFQAFSPVVDNTIWLAGNSMLSKFNTGTKKITVYTQQDGLPERKPTGRKIYFDAAHHFFYLFADDYLAKFTSTAKSNADNSSDLLIQELAINNTKYIFNPEPEVHLEYTENNLVINYAVIDFEKNNYQFIYNINKADNWVIAGQQRSINLTNLQPGKYFIQVKVNGKSGNEKLKTITVFIDPPFWKTTWFILMCGLFLAGLFYYLYKQRIKQIQQKANIDKQLAQTEMKALHAQMNPHFIFNSLNSIREMILQKENREASHYLSKFAQLIRLTLNQSGQSLISLRNTLEYLERYVEMEKIRNIHFTCTLNADKNLDLDETVLPPMLIQPFIENAIWHGITNQHKNIHINVNFTKQNNQLVCTVDDNGIGINQSLENKKTSVWQTSGNENLHNPVGITNIKNRISLLNEKYKLQSNVTIQDKKNIAGLKETGTLVILHLPIEINEP